MELKDRHASATYRVIRLPDRGFGVEVTIPETYPTTVTSFATAANAEAWSVAHKQRVSDRVSLGTRWIKKR